ncbi:MAG: class I SAM-dependent methyltransferase [Chitinophagaceae bacterium]
MNTYGQSAKAVLTVNELRKSIKDKLPVFYTNNCLLSKRAFEQCTSEDVANYKASLFKGNSILVLAGGLGIDDIAFSKQFKEVISIDPDVELNDICEFNFNKLNINNITRISKKAEDFLANSDKKFDFIYIDPDRRTDDTRQILLKDHFPDCITLMPVLKKITNSIIIKCSPLYDYEQAFKELDNISKMYAISRNGEMKELLIVCHSETISKNDCQLLAVDIKGDKTLIAEFSSDSRPAFSYSEKGKYLYEAGSSIVKLRQFLTYAEQLDLEIIDQSVPYFRSDKIMKDFIGRSFEIIKAFDFSSKSCSAYLKSLNISKINLKVRGMKYSTEALRQSLKIKEGGDEFLFVLPGKLQALAFHCKKTSN